MTAADLERTSKIRISRETGTRMDKVRAFRNRAAECRQQAAASTHPAVQQTYVDLAQMWDRLAQERLAFFVAPGISRLDETDEADPLSLPKI
jgi:hypothetical protein